MRSPRPDYAGRVVHLMRPLAKSTVHKLRPLQTLAARSRVSTRRALLLGRFAGR